MLWFSAAFCLAIAMRYQLSVSWYATLVVSFFVISAAACVFYGSLRRCIAIILCAVFCGVMYFETYSVISAVSPEFEGESRVACTALDFSERNSKDTGIGVYSEVDINAHGRAKRLRSMLYINGCDEVLSPGDKFSCDAEIELPENEEDFKAESYYKSRHIDAVGYSYRLEELHRAEEKSLRYLPQYLSKAVKDKLYELFPKESAEFMASLMLGDTSGLSAKFTADLRKAGMSHAVAVSGMHISFLIGFILVFTKNKYLRLIAIPVMVMFALMVGAPQSALRAVIMQTLLILSTLVKREYDSMTALFVAAFVLVLANPYCVVDVGFLLSFFATLGIIVLFPKIYEPLRNVGKEFPRPLRKTYLFFASILAVTVSASIFTAPINAVSFGKISLIAPLSNLILTPLLNFCFILGALGTVLGFVFSPLGVPVGFIVGGICDIMTYMISLLAKLPFAELFAGSGITLLLVIYICFTVVYAIIMGRRKVRIPVVLILLAVSITAALFISRIDNAKSYEKDGVRFDVLDVGQGQCVVASDESFCIVIDCGGDKDAGKRAAFHLKSLGKKKIDALILSHAHADHTNGVDRLLEDIDVGKIYMPGADAETPQFMEISKLSKELGCEVVYISENTELSFDDISVKLFSLPEGSDENENGLITMVCDRDYETIITGDIPEACEEILIENNALCDTEAYVVGHHGSKSSSSHGFLNTILPELSVISVGKDNSYGHPARETLNRLAGIGSRVCRTDTDGQITFYSGEKEAS